MDQDRQKKQRPNVLTANFTVGLIQAAALALLLIGVYYSAYTWLVNMDWVREDYNYGYLIPFIVIYLMWEKRERFFSTPASPTWTGLVPLISAMVLFWLGELGGEFFTLYVSSWLMAVGLLWMHLGWKKLKTIGFALFIALSMFPIPNFLYNKVSVTLKLISSKIGVSMIQLYGLSAYREGNVIDLGFTQLQVVDACSGLRFLIPLIVLSILLAYFFKAHWWKRAVVVATSVPLSIITNSLRIALTGILYQIWGAKAAEGFFHGFSGWFIFMFSLAILLVEMWVLKKLPPREPVRLKTNQDPEAGSEEYPVPVDLDADAEAGEAAVQGGFSVKALFSPPQFIVSVLLLALTVALAQGIDFREKIPIATPLEQFPLKIGQWTGQRQTMEEKFIVALDLNDYVIVDYRNPSGKSVNFYTAYYQSQSKGESIHSPATCLPGSGWIFREAGDVPVKIPGVPGGVMRINRAFMQKGDFKQLSYYWFLQRGRILTNAYQLKLYVFWDALTQQRTDGALVRVITPVYADEDLPQADERLRGFIGDVVPELDKFIPGRSLK